MTAIVEFLNKFTAFAKACIAEDEAVACAATAGPWFANHVDDDLWTVGTGTGTIGKTSTFPGVNVRGDVVAEGYDDTGGASAEDAAHIARWNPARVLAECVVRWHLLELHQLAVNGWAWGGYCSECSYEGNGEAEWIPYPCPTLRILFQLFSDRPGYQEQWRP